MIFERKILSMIYGSPLKDAKKMCSERLSWAGHEVRMDVDRPAKQVFSQAQSGTRRGRQADLVDKDSRYLMIPR